VPRVLVDLLFFTGKRGGTETYVREVYSRLGQQAPARGWELLGFASRELAERGADWFPGRIVDSGISSENRARWAWGEVAVVARAARRLGADLVHAPANFGPVRSSVPLLLTLHDLLAFEHPEWLPTKGPAAWSTRWLIKRAAGNARRIMTVSEDAKGSIVRRFGRPPEEVEVVPLAGGAAPVQQGSRQPLTLFSLGNRMPHKNFPRLVEALALIPEQRRPRLTISGSHGDDPLRPVVERTGMGPWVRLEGWLPPAEVERLYAESAAVVLPTMFEGFGLPVLEAMARGCPVICSDIPVLREVAGPAAAYFDPREPAAIARVLERTLHDPALLAQLAEAGRGRASTFSWDRTAAQVLEAFEATLGSGARA